MPPPPSHSDSSLATAPVKVRSAIAEGCVLCAERLWADGKSAEAAEIYDEVRKAEVPKQRLLEATRGAILARNQEGIPLLLEQFRSPDKGLFQLALSTAREFPGGQVDKALAAELASATPERAALMIHAMADRKETVVLAAVLKAAEQGPETGAGGRHRRARPSGRRLVSTHTAGDRGRCRRRPGASGEGDAGRSPG